MAPVISVREFLDEDGASPFGRWFQNLDSTAAAIVTVAIARLADGNTSRVKPIGEGAAELKIDRGPGYRVYFGWDGSTLVILLGGRNEEAAERRYQGRHGVLAQLQGPEINGNTELITCP